jgi:hypothetical protein
MKAVESEENGAGDDQQKTEKDEGTAKIGHGRCSGSGQKGGGLAQQLRRLAWFGENAYRPGKLTGLLTHILQVGVEAGENKDAAAWQLERHVLDQIETIAPRHRHVAKQKMGSKGSRTDQGLIRGVNGLGFKPILAKDKGQGIGYQTIIVNDQNSLHG